MRSAVGVGLAALCCGGAGPSLPVPAPRATPGPLTVPPLPVRPGLLQHGGQQEQSGGPAGQRDAGCSHCGPTPARLALLSQDFLDVSNTHHAPGLVPEPRCWPRECQRGPRQAPACTWTSSLLPPPFLSAPRKRIHHTHPVSAQVGGPTLGGGPHHHHHRPPRPWESCSLKEEVQ